MLIRLAGKPPANASESLVERIIGEGKSAPLPWLEERVRDELYRAELRRGAWETDIGVWGPTLFRTEAARVLGEMRPEFARLVTEDEAENAFGAKSAANQRPF